MSERRPVSEGIPRFIYFTGVDGSGKSTYVQLLATELRRRGLKTKKVWLRFNYLFTKLILLYCRLAGLTRRPLRAGRKISVHEFYRSPTVGRLVQYGHFIDTCICYFFKVYLPLKFTKVCVLCDRFSYDILADFMVENRDLEMPQKRIARRLANLVPKDGVVIYLAVSRDEIIRRKPSVLDDDEDFDLKYRIYTIIGRSFDFARFDNNSSVESVFSDISSYVGLRNPVGGRGDA